ncbi:DMT family transporter [Lacibacterium aquatile]|uniref:DMT family transporter n=1 Tax=Lacibacterium aquatile TaxID=1168082 RepID=A0ABW5DNJ9_9PROT
MVFIIQDRLPVSPLTPIQTGIALRLSSVLLFAGLNICIRLSAADVPLGELMFFRSAVALIPLGIYLAIRGEFLTGFRTKYPWGHVLRSLFGCTAMATSFTSMSYLPLANATALAFITPMVTVVAAILLLGERPKLIVYIALAMGFCGIITMLSPALRSTGLDHHTLIGTAAGIAAAMSSAAVITQVKKLTKTELPATIALYFAITCSIVGLATLPLGWVFPSLAWNLPHGTPLIALIMGGILGGIAQIMMTEAFARAPASTLAPFEYTSMMWALMADIIIFSVWPGPQTLLGSALIVGAAALVALSTRRRA